MHPDDQGGDRPEQEDQGEDGRRSGELPGPKLDSESGPLGRGGGEAMASKIWSQRCRPTVSWTRPSSKATG